MYYSSKSTCPKCGHFIDPYSENCAYCGYRKANEPDTFPARLKKARKAKGLTQPALAEAAHTSVSSMCGYEKGKTFPPLDTAVRISKVLGVSLDYLAGLDKQLDKIGQKGGTKDGTS